MASFCLPTTREMLARACGLAVLWVAPAIKYGQSLPSLQVSLSCRSSIDQTGQVIDESSLPFIQRHSLTLPCPLLLHQTRRTHTHHSVLPNIISAASCPDYALTYPPQGASHTTTNMFNSTLKGDNFTVDQQLSIKY